MASEDVRRKLANLASKMPNEVGRALYQEAEIEKTESMERTPVQYGALRGSHEVGRPVQEGRDISVTIAVGGPSAPYCISVHENMEAYHKVGQAKFLESTILESRAFMANRIARRIDLNRLV